MDNKVTVIATGDSFMTRRLPAGGYPGFDALRDVIASHDVCFNNLETTLHRQEGYPSASSGGTWAMSDPEILDDLKRYGFNLFNTANNHSCDFCHGGLLATIRYLRENDLQFAGTGANLAEAAAPAYFDAPNARVALLASCSTFRDGAYAGNQSSVMKGRPGLNPLRVKKVFHVTKDDFETLRRIVNETHINAQKDESISLGYSQPFPEGILNFGGHLFQCDTESKTVTEPDPKDLDRMLAGIREAKKQADYVLVSIHSHEFEGDISTEPAQFMKTYCHACIDAGADAILGHGPHAMRGIEMYRGKPIFYSLGNFIFQTETVAVQPAEAFENAGMPVTTTIAEYMDHRSANGTRGFNVIPEIWQAFMAGITFEDGMVKEIRIYPITLQMGQPRSKLGWPLLTNDQDVVDYLNKLCSPFGTHVYADHSIFKIQLC